MIGRIGVCSWSLRPRNPRELAKTLVAAGLENVQLALDPIRDGRWKLEDTVRELDRAGVRIVSGMMGTRGEDYATLASIRRTGGFRPDAHWQANLAAVEANARIARELALDLVTLHAGFLSEDERDPERAKLVSRLGTVADAFGAQEVQVGLETGQETALTLLAFLGEIDRANVGVNFDPANLILYGIGEPIGALRALGPHVFQVHVKDAVAPGRAGEWGREVPVGTGEVDWSAFFDLIAALERPIDCLIEREAGRERAADIVRAKELVLEQSRRR